MKIFNKIALIAGIASISLASCESEYPEYSAGPQAAQDSTVVFFTNPDKAQVIVGIEDTAFTIAVSRYATEAATYGLSAVVFDADNALIKVPASVTFDEGCTDTTFMVKIGDLELMKNYFFTISLDESVANPYKESTDYTQIVVNLLKEDYALYATGTYTDAFLYEQSWDKELQYSPALDLYRFKDCWWLGTDVTFAWDGSEAISVTPEVVATGYDHPSYGMIYANYLADYCYAECDSTANTVKMYFGIKWTVSAGSFGAYFNTFEFTRPNVETTEQE